MKTYFLFILILISAVMYSQKKISKQVETVADEINIYTSGLDDIIIENSDSDFVEVFLYAVDYDSQLIKIENKTEALNINFEFKGTQTREVIFRKFITKRLQRANAIVRIPKNKKVYLFGENVDIESKNFQNTLAIYIENGIVKLNQVRASTLIKLYSGNVFASTRGSNINVKSSSGKILVKGVLNKKEYQKTIVTANNELKIITIKGNVFLDPY